MFIDFLMNFYSSFQGWLISGILFGLGIFLKKSYNGYIINKKTEQEKGRQEFQERLTNNLVEKMNECQTGLNEKINLIQKENSQQEETLRRINNGLLSVQGKNFREECRRLLKQEHDFITVEEMEQCTEDHASYNAMGGNDTGDELYKLVTIKFQNQRQQK